MEPNEKTMKVIAIGVQRPKEDCRVIQKIAGDIAVSFETMAELCFEDDEDDNIIEMVKDMVTSFQQATMQQVGTEAHGGYKFLTQEQYDKVAADKKVKDISYDIFVASAENKQLNKTATEIRYSEPKDAGWSFSTPTTGTLPKKKYDIATDTAVLDALGVPHKLGETVTLTFSSQGKRYTQAFTLCGFWKGSIALGVNEAYVSREYCDQVAPVIKTPLYESGSSDYSGTINASLWFSTPWNLDKQMSDLTKRCGFDKRVNEGVNWAYAASTVDSTTMPGSFYAG